MLTGIFSPTRCSECKLCCNFHRNTAWETPALQPEQVFILQEMCVPLEKRADGTTSFYLHFTSDSPDEVANCPMLDTCTGCTLPREQRPFECRIWPLRIMKKSNRKLIGIYENCPALSGNVFENLKSYAISELLPEILSYATRNPEAIRDYDSSYKIIWSE